jgi:hypothetical protein
MKAIAYVELKDGQPIRIFRTVKSAMAYSAKIVTHPELKNRQVVPMARMDAVRAIRNKIFEMQGHRCLWCGEWLAKDTAQMHEQQPRGEGGEISLENSIVLCYDCHQGRKDSAHGNRRLHFGGK